MNANEFIADLREIIPRFTRSKVKLLLILFAAFLFFVALFAVMLHLLSTFEEFSQWFKTYRYLGVFLANLLSSMGVMFPTPPGVVVTVGVAREGSPFWVAIAASIGGTLGELTAYYVGYGGKKLLHLQRYESYQTAERWMKRYGGLAVFTFALLPLFIFDLVGIAAGALRFPVKKFLLFCLLGRLPRAFIEAYFYTWIFNHMLVYLPDWMQAPFAVD